MKWVLSKCFFLCVYGIDGCYTSYAFCNWLSGWVLPTAFAFESIKICKRVRDLVGFQDELEWHFSKLSCVLFSNNNIVYL